MAPLNPWESDIQSLLYLYLRRKFSPRLAHWVSHPLDKLCEWLYWRNILMLPWEDEGWKLNTKKNQERRRIKMLGDKFISSNF